MLIVAFIQMGVEGDELRRMRPASLAFSAAPSVFSPVPGPATMEKPFRKAGREPFWKGD